MKKRRIIAVTLALLAVARLSALEVELAPYGCISLGWGEADAPGDFLGMRGAFYAGLGASSYATPGSWAAFSPLLGGDIGLDCVLGGGGSFPLKPPFSCVIGLEAGPWGFGGVRGFKAADPAEAFAWTQLRVLALSARLSLRYTRDFEPFSCYAEAGPIAGTALGYRVCESQAGVDSSLLVPAQKDDLGFAGAGASLGVSYNVPGWSLGLELRGGLALTDLAGEGGALGARLGRAAKLGLSCCSTIHLGGRK